MADDRVELTIPVDVGVPATVLWTAVTDWPGQSDWMLGTRVELTGGDRRSVGSTLRAVTGAGPLGVADTMEITRWDPPRRCDVIHTGRVLRGSGWFAVEPLEAGRCRVVWEERLELPLGRLGRAGWPVVRPLARAGLRLGLRRFARLVTGNRA